MLFSLLLTTGIAAAYSLNDRYWDHAYPSEEPFTINAESFPDSLVDDTTLKDHFELALDIWNTQGQARIHLDDGGEFTDYEYGGGNNDYNTTLYIETYEGTALAKARHSAINDALTDCDIAFYGQNLNGVIPWSFAPNGGVEGTYDFAHTMIHEMGHCVGIGHSEFKEAVMYSSSTKGSGWEKRDLHLDDIQALQAIYGVAEVTLSLDNWTLIDDNNDGFISPDESAYLVITVLNSGNVHAYDVDGQIHTDHPALNTRISTSESPLGDVAPGAREGDLSTELRFRLEGNPDCLPTPSVPLSITISDMHANTTVETIEVPVRCPFSYAKGSVKRGCGCEAGNARASILTTLTMMIALMRRRDLFEQGQKV